jgi:uncharacterized protein YbgA (DUF1722 family)
LAFTSTKKWIFPTLKAMKEPLEQAISQDIRNQADDYIPKLFVFSQLLLAISANDAAYATTGTAAAFWSKWRELEDGGTKDISKAVGMLINRLLSKAQNDRLFADRFGYVRTYFDELEGEGRTVIYTLLGSYRRHDVNPINHLKDLFTRLPAAKITQTKGFAPSAWAKARASEKLPAKAA